MISENLQTLRRIHEYSQEYVAEQVGVSRQTVAKWESGTSIPDIIYSSKLAELYNVSIDDLLNFKEEETIVSGLKIPPKGKYMFGVVTIGERGQIVIPAKARKVFNLKPGDDLLVLGDIEQGIALTKPDFFVAAAEMFLKKEKEGK